MFKRILPLIAILAIAAPAMAQKVAIANPVKIFNAIKETKDVNTDMNNRRQAVEVEVNARKKEIEQLQQAMNQFKADTPAYTEAQTKLLNADTAAKIWLQSKNTELANNFRAHARRMADKINTAIAEVAKAKGVDIVIAEQKAEIPEAEIDKIQPNQYMQILIMHPVLYNTPETEITQDVIAKLDQQYNASGAAPTTPAAPAAPAK